MAAAAVHRLVGESFRRGGGGRVPVLPNVMT
jgi:hypothetical protein